MIGQLLDGRYKIVEVLGSGTFGKTYLAEDTKRPGNPICVVKQLKPASSDPAIIQIARRLFNTEAETLEKLGTHPQIPQLFAYLESGGEFYLVQEYIAGHPLTQELVPDKPLQEEEVTGMLLELLEILDFVHGNNVIHRDISPKNIMRRDRDKKLFLIDFGAVKKVSSQGPTSTIMIGTPGYMPVEQIAGNPDLKSDVYAVGMIAIEALTGKHPLQLPVNPATQEVIWRDRVPVSQKLGDILDKMVRRDFPQRYSTKEALEAVRNLKKPSGLRAFFWGCRWCSFLF
jgi:serine/threonine-protein kinase